MRQRMGKPPQQTSAAQGAPFGAIGSRAKGIGCLQKYAARQCLPAPHLLRRHCPGAVRWYSASGRACSWMKQYLESSVLQGKILEFWKQDKVIGAICHGVSAAPRTIDPQTGKSILYGLKVTALTKDLEMTGFGLTFWLLGRRYRTYPCYVADEVRGVLGTPGRFQSGQIHAHSICLARWPVSHFPLAAGCDDFYEPVYRDIRRAPVNVNDCELW